MASAPSPKRFKPNGSTGPLIATHNGHFHADEALAVYLLRLLPTYSPSRLLRTRDPALLSTAHTVVDVGGEYLPQNNRYDHHQRTFDTTFPARPTKLSSAGLVYLHFGKAIIAQRTGLNEDSTEVETLWHKIYEEFIEALDAHDNGISAYDPAQTKGLDKRFHDSGVGLGSLVNDLNWHFDDDGGEDKGGHGHAEGESHEQAQQAAEDERFLSASSLMGETFLRKLTYFHRAWLPARALVRSTYERRKDFDSAGRIMVFEKGCPWKDHLYSLEEQTEQTPSTSTSVQASDVDSKVLYVLYPESDTNPSTSKWRVQAVPVSKDSFESRKPLPSAWRGLRDRELDNVSGIEGCVFVHASGFVGGNGSREGALDMARRAVELGS